MELSSFDYQYLVQEWQKLVKGRIQKIYLKERALILHIYAGKENHQLIITDGVAFLSKAKMAFPKDPPGFCMFLRKRIQGLRIHAIEQTGFDRIIKITTESKEGPLELVIELLGKMNVMLLKEGKIISCFETHTYTDRTIRGGVQYVPPPARAAPWDADFSTLKEKEAAKALATELGLGGKYAEEACLHAGLDRKHIITERDLAKLEHAIKELRDKPINAVYSEKDALPFEFASRPGAWHKADSFNAALDAVLGATLEDAEISAAQKVTQEQIGKHDRIRLAQEAKAIELEEKTRTNREAGEKIYEHYTELKTLLAELKKDWKEMDFKALQKKYEGHKYVKELHKDGTFEVEL